MKVVFFGDNVPKDRADIAMEAAKTCDAFLVIGSSSMTFSAFRLVRCYCSYNYVGYIHTNLMLAVGLVKQTSCYPLNTD